MLEILGKIGFDWKLALANLVNFFVIFYILKRFVFKPIAKIVEDRKAVIDTGLNYAKEIDTQREKQNEEYEKFILKSKTEAQEILISAKNEKDKIIEIAKIEAIELKDEMLRRADKEINKQRLELDNDIRQASGELIAIGVKKILEEEVDEKMNARLINRLVK